MVENNVIEFYYAWDYRKFYSQRQVFLQLLRFECCSNVDGYRINSLGADDGFAYPMREEVFGHIIINYVFRVPKITW